MKCSFTFTPYIKSTINIEREKLWPGSKLEPEFITREVLEIARIWNVLTALIIKKYIFSHCPRVEQILENLGNIDCFVDFFLSRTRANKVLGNLGHNE